MHSQWGDWECSNQCSGERNRNKLRSTELRNHVHPAATQFHCSKSYFDVIKVKWLLKEITARARTLATPGGSVEY